MAQNVGILIGTKTLASAYKTSCVPCYQQLARKVGTEKMKSYLDKIAFGKMLVDSATLDNFWLQGNSRITSFEQIDFLKRLYQNQLPFSEKTLQIVKKIMIYEENENYTIRYKTGWASRGEMNVGWLVGYVQTQDNAYIFATNVEKKEGDEKFIASRKAITYQILQKLHIIKLKTQEKF
jgi:beta-lactamase class D